MRPLILKGGGPVSLEKYLIEHCSPTLASLKTASLFSLTFRSEQELEEQLKQWNDQLGKKGIVLLILRRQNPKALIYVCRKSHLRSDLKRPEVARFLAEYGYECTDTAYALNRLKERLACGGDFPHEIGLFLGYPLGDVRGFIHHAGKNCKCTGCWKVYGNECEAVKTFARFRKCRDIYVRLWNQGRSVWQLTVAA